MKRKLLGFCLVLGILLSTISAAFAEDWIYTVRRGDTIWGLSHKYLKEPLKFKEIQTYNNVEFDKLIPPGTTLKFPLEYLKFGPAEVSVVAMKGQATFTRRGQTQNLSLSSTLTVNDQINTGENSNVALRFADGSELLLGQNSELIFDVQTKYGETGMVDSRMRLNKGSAEGRVEKLIGPGAHFEVHTPSAVATVRGTEFRVRVDEGDASVVFNEVAEGRVSVDLDQQNQMINQGFGIKTQQGEPLAPPKPLLPKPNLDHLLKQYPGHPVVLDWPAIDGAVSYQLELFKDAKMTQLVDTYQIPNPQMQLPTIPTETYTIRARAVDQEGLQGLDSSHRFTIAKVPQSPAIQATSGEFLAGKAINFEWQPSIGANAYQWQAATTDDFSQVAYEQQVNSNSLLRNGDLAPADYYWRVAGINENGRGPFSEPLQVSITLPETPKVSEIDDIEFGEEAPVEWSSVELADAYHWQVATDAEFDDIVAQGETADTQTAIADLPQQPLYFRVAAKAPFNEQRYSQVQPFEVVEPDNGKTAFSIGSVLLFILLL